MKQDKIKWHIACIGKMRNMYKIITVKPSGERMLRRPRHRWKNTIKMDLEEIRQEEVNWIYRAQDRDK
jgi:hypothetical protein